MATTPATRSTGLARRWLVDIDTADYPSVGYTRLMGSEDIKPLFDPRTAPDEAYEDDGAMREIVTGYAWRLEGKIKNSTNADGTSRDSVHAFLRAKLLAHRASNTADVEFGVRFYDADGLPEAHEGRCYVKSWTPDGGVGPDLISIVLQGQGQLADITNPAASQLPVVESVSPATGDADGGNLVTIRGIHFTGATVVNFGATGAAFTLVSDSHIVAVAPAGSAGTVQTKVTTPVGVSANTAADDYVYTA